MDANVLTPWLLGQGVDAAQVVSDQRWMIQIDAVAISPFKTVLTQNFRKAKKKDGVVCTDSVKRDHELQHEGD